MTQRRQNHYWSSPFLLRDSKDLEAYYLESSESIKFNDSDQHLIISLYYYNRWILTTLSHMIYSRQNLLISIVQTNNYFLV